MDSLYIHIPFCEKKCFYCSFVVSVGQEQRVDPYLDCLEIEAQRYPRKNIGSVYIGGGTPTFLTARQVEKLSKIIHESFNLSDNVEWTVEANPEGLEDSKLKVLKESGVNRISLGIQSLQDHHLKYLGRCHDSQTALNAFDVLRTAGFKNVNLDLMYSFPGQTDVDIERDVRDIAALGSEHLSLYALTIEPNSRFFAKAVELSDSHHRAEQYRLVLRVLEEYGFHQYEVSNFAKQGFESRHNINYWQGGNYIGLGIGAHSHEDGRRYWNTPKLTTYISRIEEQAEVVDGSEDLQASERFLEALLFGLRMNRGAHVVSLEQKFGAMLGPDQKQTIQLFLDEGFMSQENGYLKVTDKGRVVLDELSAQII